MIMQKIPVSVRMRLCKAANKKANIKANAPMDQVKSCFMMCSNS